MGMVQNNNYKFLTFTGDLTTKKTIVLIPPLTSKISRRDEINSGIRHFKLSSNPNKLAGAAVKDVRMPIVPLRLVCTNQSNKNILQTCFCHAPLPYAKSGFVSLHGTEDIG